MTALQTTEEAFAAGVRDAQATLQAHAGQDAGAGLNESVGPAACTRPGR